MGNQLMSVFSIENALLEVNDAVHEECIDDSHFLSDADLLEGLDKFLKDKNQSVRILHNPISYVADWLGLSPELRWLCDQPYIEPLSKEWFEVRRDHITGSEVGSVLDINPYTSREQLFLLKTNQCPPMEDNEATRHGRKFEPKAGELYCSKTKRCGLNFGFIKDPKHSFIGVTPDIITIDGVCCEIKSPRYRKIEEDMDEERMQMILPYYWHQCQMQVNSVRLNSLDFIQYGTAPNRNYLSGDVLSIHHLIPDQTWFEQNESEIFKFWEEMMQYRFENPDWNKKVWPNNSLKITKNVRKVESEIRTTLQKRKCPF